MRHTENADDPNAGGPAFPIKGPLMSSDVLGMTLRDYFAAKAMHAYWSDPTTSLRYGRTKWLTPCCKRGLPRPTPQRLRHARPGGQDAYRLPGLYCTRAVK